jgi:hypothetical protein
MNRITISRWMLALLLVNPLMTMAMEDAQSAADVQPGAQDEAQPVDQQNAQPAADAQADAQPAAQEANCRICLEDPDDDEFSGFRRLACGHQYCRGCLTDRINNGFNEWRDLENHMRCPREFCPHGEKCANGRGCPERIRCPHIMNAVDIRNVTEDDAQVVRYNNILTDRFIDANPNFRRCPTPRCEVIYEFDRVVRTIQCDRGCHQEYCAACGLPHPQGAECGVVPDNNNANEEWIRANTRPCPNCRANIQKNEGCNHMTCRACQFEFCWFHLRAWNEDCRRGHWFNDHPELEAEAVQAAQALRAPVQQVQPVPGIGDDQMTPEQLADALRQIQERFAAGIGDDQMTPEQLADYARQFAQLEQNNNDQIRPNPNGPNDPNPDGGPNGGGPNDPNPGNNRPRLFRAQPKPSKAPIVIGAGLIMAAVAATAYGCYKLYNYLIQPKPHVQKDVKTALADLHKEAVRSKNIAISSVYIKGAIKAFFDAQVKANSFAALTQEKMAMLTARVNALEDACSNQRAIEEEYAVFMRCVSDLIVQANQPAPAVTSVAMAPEVQVKQTVAKKVPTRIMRRGRPVRKVK